MRINAVLFLLVLFFLFYGCEDDFSPKGDEVEKYAVFAVLNADTNYQQIVVSKVYQVEGYDPYSHQDDPTVRTATVNIHFEGSEYNFLSKEINVSGSDSFIYPTSVYYNDSFKPAGNSKPVDLEITFETGKTIHAKTSTPERFDFDFGQSGRFIPVDDSISVYWFRYQRNNIYSPRMVLNYYIEQNDGSLKKFEAEIPPHPYFRHNDGRTKPSENDHVIYRMKDIEEIFRKISDGDPYKNRYYIGTIDVDVIVMERNLAAYYVTSNPWQNEYVVLVDENDYSNIENGLGILGVFRKHTWEVFIVESFLNSFGYKKFNP